MQDLTVELNKLRQDLNFAIKEIRERGQAKSIAERDYRVALATNILVLRDNKIPVTIINDLSRGNEKIADLKLARDIAESLYDSNIQYIYSVKLNIDIVMKQMDYIRKGV